MSYKINPKINGSGIYACIPQTGFCSNNCADCFFQSGRSYLEPLNKNLPNIPTEKDMDFNKRIVRINDGNDSNINREKVMEIAKQFPLKFYNTAIPKDLNSFDAPIVVTINPAEMTDKDIYFIDKQDLKNVMFVRVRTNLWNLNIVENAVNYYSNLNIPIVLTFMAYYNEESILEDYKKYYRFRKRTLNSYWAITTAGWEKVMSKYKYNKWVYSCGKIEGELGITSCERCGNCVREFFVTLERISKLNT